MNLFGYSYGVGVAYAAAGRETQQHPILQDVKGLVAVDQVMKYSAVDESSRQSVCNAAAAIKKQMDDGVYQNSGGVVFGRFGNLATTAPNDPSHCSRPHQLPGRTCCWNQPTWKSARAFLAFCRWSVYR